MSGMNNDYTRLVREIKERNYEKLAQQLVLKVKLLVKS